MWATWRVRKADAGEWHANCFLASLWRALLSAAAPPGTQCASACLPLPLLPLDDATASLPSSQFWLVDHREREANTPSRGKLVKTGGQGTDRWFQTWQKKPQQNLESANIIHESQCEKPFTTQLPEGLRIVAECYVWTMFPPRRTVVSFTETPPAQRSRSVFEWMWTVTLSLSMSHSLNVFVQVMWSLTSLPAW